MKHNDKDQSSTGRGGNQRLSARKKLLLFAVLLSVAWFWLGTTARRADHEQLRGPADASAVSVESSQRSPQWLVMLALSGGGTRAAALAYGVMQELAATQVHTPRGSRRLLDEIDVISSVSGGSFVSAYYGLFGDRLFDDFRQKMLLRPIESELVKGLVNPLNWQALASDYYGRNDMAADLYDQILFEGKTFADINAATAPWIIINASDIGTGERVVFTRRFFDLLCLDLASYRLSRAVAASSAVPGAATPISLENRAAECDYRVPDWLRRPLDDTRHPAVQAKARGYLKYLDSTARPWLHLVDGGISDNLGLRHFHTFFSTDNDPQRLADAFDKLHISDVLIISVNAAVNRDWAWAKRPEQPSEKEVLAAMTHVQMSQFTEDTKHIVRDVYRDWVEQLSEQGARVNFELVEVAFSSLGDEREREVLNRLPTSLQLDEADVDLLIATGRRLLRESAEYQRFLGRHGDAVPPLHETSPMVE